MGRCSYIGNDEALIAVKGILQNAAGVSNGTGNAVTESVLSGIYKEQFDFIGRLCSGNISLEKFGNVIMVDAKFTNDVSLSSFELQRIYDIIKSGADSFSITNSGNSERSFSISYSFTVPEGSV